MANYYLGHTAQQLDSAIDMVLNGYKDVSKVTATKDDVLVGKVIVDSNGNIINGVVNTQDYYNDGYQDGLEDATPTLQSKEVTPNTNVQVIIADATYDGLSQVKVLAIPQNFIDETYQQGYEAGLAAVKPYKCELEYIQSSGTQYIDTGFKPNNNTKISIDFEVASLPSTYGAIFSARNNGSGVSAFSLWVNPSTPCFLWQYNTGSGKSTAKNSPSVVGTRLVAENTGNVMNVGGFNLTESSATFNTNYSIYLLATNDPDANRYCTSAKIYSCQIYDNGTLVRDFIPVLDYCGTACLYDKVGKQLYYNNGTGTFSYA